jgi:hypothetical protein
MHSRPHGLCGAALTGTGGPTRHRVGVCVVLTRHPEQIAAIDGLGLGNCIVPRTAIDSRSLMYEVDVDAVRRQDPGRRPVA